jgi:curli production assembly/transport component CsgG
MAASALALAGCVGLPVSKPAESNNQAGITPASESARDLAHLPPPKGKIVAAVYGFRDQTGQYKPAPDSSFSTAVTQGATSILLKSLRDSQWFVPVERENLQNLLTERKIVRAVTGNGNAPAPQAGPPPLIPASIILEGGIVAYETNVKTGGAGARYLGIGASTIYRTDQVTIVLRAIDIRTGRILNSVSTTKAIYSHQIDLSVFKFVKYKHLLEMEAGYTRNEPAQMCVTDAIEAAVVHLIVQGLMDNSWALRNPADINSPIIQTYLAEQRSVLFDNQRSEPPAGAEPSETQPAIEQKQDQTSRLEPPPVLPVMLETVGFAQRRDEQLEFRLHLSAPPPVPQVYTTSAPALLWFDFPNTGVRNGHRHVRVERGPVVGMNAIQDSGRMRVVFRLRRPVAYVMAVEGNDYVLTLRWPRDDSAGASTT